MSDSGFLELEKGTASPSAGATDFDRFYVDPADNKLTRKKSDGNTEKYLTNVAGVTAAQVSVTPAGAIASTDVQAALQELDTEKVPVSQLDSANTAGTVPVRDGSGVFETQRLDTVEGVTALSGTYLAEFKPQQLKMTDPSSIVRTDITLSRVDLRDAGGEVGSILQNGGDLNFSISGSGKYNFGGKRLTSIGNATGYNDAVNLGSLTHAGVIYVSPSGNDATANGSIASAYQTIGAAVAAAPSGSTIVLMTGGYTEPIVALPDNISIVGMSSGNVNVFNGFSHTSTATNVGINIQGISFGAFNIDTSLCISSMITFRSCSGYLNLAASNGSSFVYFNEGNIYGATVAAGAMSFNECLLVGAVTASAGLVIFENSKFVTRVEASGTAIVRMLDCELFSATEFINGASGSPTWQVDVATDYLGGYVGSLTKVLMQDMTFSTFQAKAIPYSITVPTGYTYIRSKTKVTGSNKIKIEGTGTLKIV